MAKVKTAYMRDFEGFYPLHHSGVVVRDKTMFYHDFSNVAIEKEGKSVRTMKRKRKKREAVVEWNGQEKKANPGEPTDDAQQSQP